MTKVLTGIEAQAPYLRRLSIVFADELRLKIVTELYIREMSPKQFYEEFGGGSISRVDRHFKRLAEHGWLKFVRSESGGRRRGGTEHFYRATELAIFDDETWSLVPYSMRVAFSWRTFEQLAKRVREALQAETFDARADSHLSWTPLLLDQLGWKRVTAAMGELFKSLLEEQADAKLRLYESEEESILATVALSAFESPARPRDPGEKRAEPSLAESGSSPFPLILRLSKVFADELCLKIVAELNLREMSALQFHEEFGGAPVDAVRRRFKMLTEIGWLRRTRTETGGRRRGAIEHFYRATGPVVFDSDTWADVPSSVKASYSWRTFEQLSAQVREAIEAGTFEGRPDNHLSWSLLRLDQAGWARTTGAVDTLFEFIFKEQERAKLRLTKSGETPVTTTIALAAFESPKDSAKAP